MLFDNHCMVCDGHFETVIPLDDDVRKLCEECEKELEANE